MADVNVGTLSGKIELEDRLTAVLEGLLGKIDRVEQKTSSFGGRILEVAGGFAIAEMAGKAFNKVLDITIGLAGDLTEGLMSGADISENFERLATNAGMLGDELLGRLREGTQGTIRDMELMKVANQNMAAGLNLTAEQYGVTAKAAFALAQATGGDVATALEAVNRSLITGQTRGVKMLTGYIDMGKAQEVFAMRLGTTVDKLTEEGKLQAIRETIFKRLGLATERLGEQTAGLDEFVSQAQATYRNFMDDLGRQISISPVVVAALESIKKELKAAFGGEQQDLITTVVGLIEEAAIMTIDLATAGLEMGRIVVGSWNTIHTASTTIMNGWRALTFMIGSMHLKWLEFKNVLTFGRFDDEIAATRSDLDGLYNRMAEGLSTVEGLQSRQDGMNKALDAGQEALNRVQAAMQLANRENERGAQSTAALAGQQTLAAGAATAHAEAQDEVALTIQKTYAEQQRFREALAEINALGLTYEETLADVSEGARKLAKQHLEAGASVTSVQIALGLTNAEMKALQTTMRKDQEILKATQKSVEDTAKIWADYHLLIVSRTGTTTDYQLARVEEWRSEQLRTLDMSQDNWKAHYEAINKFADEWAAGTLIDWNLLQQNSKDTLNDIADRTRETYQHARSHSSDYTREFIDQLREQMMEARRAARGIEDAIGGSLDNLAGKAGVLTDRIKEASSAARGPVSFDVTRANLDELARFWGIPSNVAFAAAERGFSFAEILQAWQSKTFAEWVPAGPRIAGFSEGGVGDFGTGTLAMLHGREAIVPLEKSGVFGDVVNNFYVNGTADDVARRVGDILMRQLKTSRQFGSI